MSFVGSVLSVALLAGPPVEVSTLDGKSVRGELEGIAAAAVTVREGGAARELPIDSLLEVRFAPPAAATPATEATIRLALVDGTRLRCANVTAAGDDVSVSVAGLDPLKLPVASVAHLRFADGAGAIEQAWIGLTERELKRDLLVVRKGDVLDHLEGTVGTIDDKQIQFVLDGNAIPVSRTKVFGVVYGRRAASTDGVAVAVSLADGDLLSARSLTTVGDRLRIALASGGTTTASLGAIKSIDFSFGKIRYLSQMDPRQVDETFFFDDEADRWLKRYRRDRNQDGGAIRVGNREYARGLWIHSRTTLRYRLSGEYRRFQAVMGIEESDPDVARQGDVRVTIVAIMPGDERKTLLEADVRGADRKPQTLDLDVTGARDLEVFVDYGGNLDVADHLALGDARLLK